jgi:AcrR family transcriptional regulator
MADVADAEPAPPAAATGDPGWRERAVARSLNAARSRAEERVQRLLDAAFELIDEKGSTDFTIQEVVERSKQSLRGFYEYFDGKDELVLALFEETVREAVVEIHTAVDAETEPLARLRAFAITLHEWCDPDDVGPATTSNRGRHRRRPISEFSMHLAPNHADRVRAALAPQTRLLRELISAAADAGAIRVSDVRAATALVQQTVMYSWFGNRLVADPGRKVDADKTWEFCLNGLNTLHQ